MTLKELYQKGNNTLEENEVTDHENDAWLLLEYIFNIDRSYFFVHGEEEADRAKASQYEEAIKKRAEHLPLQHITGYQDFMNYRFCVNENVLVPRQDTEILVEKAFEEAKRIIATKLAEGVNKTKSDEGKPTIKILDMCTGSGCIAISIYKMLEEGGFLDKADVWVTGVDISAKALEIAEKNARSNAAKVDFVNSNLFEKLGALDYDLIVSNPPYIEKDEIPLLMEEVRKHEPIMALDGGRDGLDFYKAITKKVCENINECTVLYEIGYNQAESLIEIFSDLGYKEIMIVKDLAGLDRVAKAKKC